VVATTVGLAMFLTVLAANVLGLRVSAGFQLALSSVLIVVVALAVAVALPSRGGDHWSPFAPHGCWAIGTAANILVWLFIGWEAVAQLAGDFRRPEVELPRAVAIAYVTIAFLYLGLAVATIGVTYGTGSRVPLADLISVGFGRVGRDATAVLAVALTMGTMNVYTSAAAKLAASMATDGALPRWLAGDAERSVPRRPLAVIAPVVTVILAGLAAGVGSTDDLVRATSALFIAVYVLALAAAVRILDGRVRTAAIVSLVATCVLGVFSTWFLVVPVVVAVLSLTLRRQLLLRSARGLREPDRDQDDRRAEQLDAVQ
jgi:amino acid efflux transporter